MHWRLQKLAAATWLHTQYRFRREAWTMDAIYVIKRLMEVFRTTRSVRRGSRFEQYNRTLYIMFEDFVKAFDSVNRELLTIVDAQNCDRRSMESPNRSWNCSKSLPP